MIVEKKFLLAGKNLWESKTRVEQLSSSGFKNCFVLSLHEICME